MIGIKIACQRRGRQWNLLALGIEADALDVGTGRDQLCILLKKVVRISILLEDDNHVLNLLGWWWQRSSATSAPAAVEADQDPRGTPQ